MKLPNKKGIIVLASTSLLLFASPPAHAMFFEVLFGVSDMVLPRPLIELPIPQAPAIPMPPTLPPMPVAVVPKPVEMSRTGGSGKPIADSRRFNTKKAGEQWARKAGGGQKPDYHSNPKDGRGPHFHPKGSHDHGYVPRSSGTYVIKKGDSLWKIAQRYGVSVDKIASANGIKDPSKIFPGQVLKF
jgi:nucleoid-associated protein YgaU